MKIEKLTNEAIKDFYFERLFYWNKEMGLYISPMALRSIKYALDDLILELKKSNKK